MTSRWIGIIGLVVSSLFPCLAYGEQIVLWHSYRGAEAESLNSLLRQWNAASPDATVKALAVPHGAYANKLSAAIPRGHGPDVFIYAHERVGDWARSGLIQPIGSRLGKDDASRFLPGTLEAFRYEGGVYGVPLAAKSLALFYNRALLPTPPQTTAQMFRFMEDWRMEGGFPLAYEAGSFYHHAPWLFGFGGSVFDEEGRAKLVLDQNHASIEHVRRWMERGYLPREATGASVTQLFNEGKAAMVINGPWFLGEVQNVDYGIAPLPVVSETGLPARPFLTVEGILFSGTVEIGSDTWELARYLALGEGAQARLLEGAQLVADERAYAALAEQVPEHISQFKAQVAQSVPMPNNPVMRSVWEPGARALRAVLRGATSTDQALEGAQRAVEIATRPRPREHNPIPYLICLFIFAVGGVYWTMRRIRRDMGQYPRGEGSAAYAYLAPAAVGMTVLVLVPFLVGTAVAFFAHRDGGYTFVGLSNFHSILFSDDYAISDPLSFYFTLGVTVMWTVTNVVLHLALGLGFAMILREPWVRCRGIFRVLLIVPWAVPNYITALIWKGLFHSQFGAVNGFLGALGVEPIPWFSHFWTSFSANLVTNTWLGFPFMMVVCLGALQAIPKELEEAAEMDGASGWTRFKDVVLPLIKPALLPAVILGSVWTFNMFNIIYLVSGGEPDGGTEILITEAYRWAFHRQEQYGYAAAYAVLIFLALIAYTQFTRRLTKTAEVS